MNEAFYRELARRVVALANALQYENAANLLHLALSASDDPAPATLGTADCEMQFAFTPIPSGDSADYDHERFDRAVASIELWLATADQDPSVR